MGKYQILYADPPWLYENWKFAKNGAQRAHYDGLTIDELREMPIGELAAKQSILLLWVTGPKLMENAHTRVCKAWGFRAATILFTWVKTYREPANVEFSNAQEKRDFMAACGVEAGDPNFKNVKNAQVLPGNWSHGNGFYTAAGTEFLVLGVRGKALPRKKLCEKQILVAPRREHSSKPNDEVRRRVRHMFSPQGNEYDTYRKIELFARPPVPEGWIALGKEIDGQDIQVALPQHLEEISGGHKCSISSVG